MNQIHAGDQEYKRKAQTKERPESARNKEWEKTTCKKVNLGKITYFLSIHNL